MNILSLFDGLSGGQIALRRAGIEYNNYFASETDKYAIQITQRNYPDTIQLGDVTKIKTEKLPNIDMLIGGSPCVGFSFAGKQLAFNDPRSALFFEYIRLLKELKPKYFLFENVNMKKEFLYVISEYLKIYPVRINSNLVSAQNRDRWYWTNIRTKERGLIPELVSDIPQPKDRKILLKDILQPENEVENKYYIQKDRIYNVDGKLPALTAELNGRNNILIQKAHGFNKGGIFKDKSPTILSNSWEHNNHIDNGRKLRRLTPIECERLQTVPDNYTKFGNHQRFLYIKQEIENGRIICKEKNVRLEDVIEKQQHTNMVNYVLCTIKDIKDMEAIITQKENFKPIRNVNIVIEKLERKVVEHEECVIDITKIGCDMETLYTQTKNEILLNPEVIMEGLMVKTDTELLWKIFLGEVLKKQSVSTISILISWIIQSRICTYVKTKANILFSIENLSVLQGNLLKWKLSNLRMESIELMSNTQRYKMLGNGFTIDVIVHILRRISV